MDPLDSPRLKCTGHGDKIYLAQAKIKLERRIIQRSNPPAMDRLGMTPATERLLAKLRRSKPHVEEDVRSGSIVIGKHRPVDPPIPARPDRVLADLGSV